MFKKMNFIVCLPELNRMPKTKNENKTTLHVPPHHPIKTFRNLMIN